MPGMVPEAGYYDKRDLPNCVQFAGLRWKEWGAGKCRFIVP